MHPWDSVRCVPRLAVLPLLAAVGRLGGKQLIGIPAKPKPSKPPVEMRPPLATVLPAPAEVAAALVAALTGRAALRAELALPGGDTGCYRAVHGTGDGDLFDGLTLDYLGGGVPAGLLRIVVVATYGSNGQNLLEVMRCYYPSLEFVANMVGSYY